MKRILHHLRYSGAFLRPTDRELAATALIVFGGAIILALAA